MNYETVDACEVCGSAERWLAVEKDRYGADYRLWCCEGCGLLYASPRLDEASAREFYATEYRKIYGEETGSHPLRSVLGKSISGFVKHFGLAPKCVLEYGCGKGDWLVELRAVFGCEVYGLDADPALRSELERLSIETTRPARFNPDLVIYNHVLEHLRDPVRVLTEARELIAPGGAIFIAVPGLYTWKRPELWQAAHNYQFTMSSLIATIAHVGQLDRLYCDEMVTSLWRKGYRDPESTVIKRFLGGTHAS